MPNILVCVSGSVAAIKCDQLVSQLQSLDNTRVRLVLTQHAQHFVDTKHLATLCQVYTDRDEWNAYKQRGDPVLHIELRKWADVMIIVPLSANTLAKLANGLCDNLLTCIARAWDFEKPFVVAPAMNTMMWNHPITNSHLNILKDWGVQCISPISKTLICGDTGIGAMEEVANIVFILKDKILAKSLK